jgi:hypothetical protein
MRISGNPMRSALSILLLFLASLPVAAGFPWFGSSDTKVSAADCPVLFPGVSPGPARALASARTVRLDNQVIQMAWTWAEAGKESQSLRNVTLVNLVEPGAVALDGNPFTIVLADQSVITGSAMKVAGDAVISALAPLPAAACAAERLGGKQVTFKLVSDDGNLEAVYSASLRDGANYIRTRLELKTIRAPLSIAEVVMFDGTVAGARTGGTAEGVPVVTDTLFFGVEHPMAKNEAGPRWSTIGGWNPQTVMADRKACQFDVTDKIRTSGDYAVEFIYREGMRRLDIHKVTLLQDGKPISTDEHFGSAGNDHKNNLYHVRAAGHKQDKGINYAVVAEICTDGGDDSAGSIRFAKSDERPYVRCSHPRPAVLAPGRSIVHTFGVGVAPRGQLRRAFLRYLEMERAHPYRTFLHYNSWYDLGYFTKYSESDCLAVVDAYGKELTEKRKVKLDSFLFDDGWDNYDSVWDFHKGFPHGFVRVGEAAGKLNAGLGVWLSPWGGYGDPRNQRLAAGKALGYENNDGGFALSGPKYYARFRDRCIDLVKSNNANHFKFDGLGRGTSRVEGSAFNSDFEAAITLIGELRAMRKDLYVNLTTGTWPSPYWVFLADSIWRSGGDHDFAGVGSDRQRWITYRDAMTYGNIVQRCPLYPINSLMLHGIIYAKHANRLNADAGNDLRSEIRSFFATGTQLQELYVTPALLSKQNWDDLAASARWARAHADILVDSHWVGGAPAKLEVYGWAAWNANKAILSLRNPADKEQTIDIDPQPVFELPLGAPAVWKLRSPYGDQRLQTVELTAGRRSPITLKPFEVLVFDASGTLPKKP